MRLKPEPLTPENFAGFGAVIDVRGVAPRVINQGTTKRFHDLAPVDVAAQSGTPLLSIFRASPRPVPIAIELMERHPLGSQAFMPLNDTPFLVLVAEGEDAVVAPSTLRAFITDGQQGVSYARNVWHHPVLALGEETDFLVVDRGGPGENLEEYWFEDAGIFLEI